jgi:hypothetical protein
MRGGNMFRQNKLLYMNGGNGGSGGVFGGKTNGQDSNLKPVARMLLGNMEEQVQGVMKIKENPRALAYVAACHPQQTVRSLAMTLLNGLQELIITARMSPHFDVVVVAFQKAGKRMANMNDDDLMEVACHSPIDGHRHEALVRLRDILASGRQIMYAESSSSQRICLLNLESASPVQNYTIINDAQKLEKIILSCSPHTEQSVGQRALQFSAEQLESIL